MIPLQFIFRHELVQAQEPWSLLCPVEIRKVGQSFGSFFIRSQQLYPPFLSRCCMYFMYKVYKRKSTQWWVEDKQKLPPKWEMRVRGWSAVSEWVYWVYVLDGQSKWPWASAASAVEGYPYEGEDAFRLFLKFFAWYVCSTNAAGTVDEVLLLLRLLLVGWSRWWWCGHQVQYINHSTFEEAHTGKRVKTVLYVQCQEELGVAGERRNWPTHVCQYNGKEKFGTLLIPRQADGGRPVDHPRAVGEDKRIRMGE